MPEYSVVYPSIRYSGILGYIKGREDLYSAYSTYSAHLEITDILLFPQLKAGLYDTAFPSSKLVRESLLSQLKAGPSALSPATSWLAPVTPAPSWPVCHCFPQIQCKPEKTLEADVVVI